MLDPFVDNFLKNYQPKKVDLTPYMKLDKLNGYKFMDNIFELRPRKTYIKYIKENNAFKDKDFRSHIKGGILIAGGTYINGIFKKLDDNSKWTHLLLEFAPFPIGFTRTDKGFGSKKIYDYDRHTFSIKINNYYIFYKYFYPKSFVIKN